MVTSFLEFRSRVDRPMALIIWGSVLVLLLAAGLTLVDEDVQPSGRVFVILVAATVVPFLLWLLFGTSYRLTETHLLVRSGPFQKSILLAEIQSVKPVRDRTSAPALSFDRFLVRYRAYDTVLVSPDDRGAFLQELAARAPHLVWQDSDLVALT